MKNTMMVSMIFGMALVMTGCAGAQRPVTIDVDPAAIKPVMTAVADWQLANPSTHNTADWTHGALYAGLVAWAEMADSDVYYHALKGFGEKNGWQPYKRIYHADDHTVGQMYIDMYKRFGDPKMVAGIKERFDFILANRSTVTLKTGQQQGKDRWWWCDALFMGPPVLAKLSRLTGDRRYLDFMNEEFWLTTEYLYDKEEHLYFRDDKYFDKREANGKKVFWSRGNGWVFGGLVRVLSEMPDDYPDRPRYEEIYRQMAAKLIAIQPEDGMWHASLLDPVSYPTKEASGSGFYCYGLAWGVNQGYLDEATYGPAIEKVWKGLVSCVHPDGKLGFVQPIGADPRQVQAEQTEVYGVGAFLLAGSEVYKMALRQGQPIKRVTVTNLVQAFRATETVELNWNDAVKSVAGLTKGNVAVLDCLFNRLLVTQIVGEGKDAKLLWQCDLAPGEKRFFWVMKQPEALAKPTSELTTFGRFVPERMDDFAWENDRIAFRMYGKALEVETISNGLDVWCKSVAYPIVDKFYKGGDYHKDHGEGGDFYKVGPTLGCGGAAPFVNGKVVMPRNFTQSKVLENGPIRTVFELTYQPWDAGGVQVSEVKRISLDLGSNLNRVECYYKTSAATLPVAAGIVIDKKKGEALLKGEAGWIAYWEELGDGNGQLGEGVVMPAGQPVKAVNTAGHLLLTTDCATVRPLVYYAGAGWSKTEPFASFDKWQAYLTAFKQRIDNPVVVK